MRVISTRMLGLKLGFALILISFVYLSQTALEDIFPFQIADYVDIEFPTELFGLNLISIFWIIFAIGLLIFTLAALDIAPFNS